MYNRFQNKRDRIEDFESHVINNNDMEDDQSGKKWERGRKRNSPWWIAQSITICCCLYLSLETVMDVMDMNSPSAANSSNQEQSEFMNLFTANNYDNNNEKAMDSSKSENNKSESNASSVPRNEPSIEEGFKSKGKVVRVNVVQADRKTEQGAQEMMKLMEQQQITPKSKDDAATEDSQRKKRKRHVTLSSLGVPEQLPPDQFAQLVNTTKVSIIISTCKQEISWIFDYINMEKYNIYQIVTYGKCAKTLKSYAVMERLTATAYSNFVRSQNIGGYGHSFASWIVDNYEFIQNDKDHLDDIVLFVNDLEQHDLQKYHSFDDVMTMASEAGVGCVVKPVCDCDDKQCDDLHVPFMFHKQVDLDTFVIDSSNEIKSDSDVPFQSNDYANLKAWKENIGLIIPQSEAIPVCYGGMFAVQKKRILKQPLQVWKNMLASLSRGMDIVESHFAERLWVAALSGADEGHAKDISETALAYANNTLQCRDRVGMLLYRRKEGESFETFKRRS